MTAIYHYARTADDIADEGDAAPEQRLADLRAYRADLQALYDGSTLSGRWQSIFTPLAACVTEFQLPQRPLDDLLDAFMQDAGNPRYTTRAELLDYCRRSADPVGRLLLHLYGISDPESLRQSDAICSALQLINFWQDLSIDGPRGRHYVPLADLERHGLSFDTLARCNDSPAARALVRELCNWAREWMLAGAPLPLRVPGRAGWELRMVVQGGLRILDRIRAMDHAALTTRPTLRPLDVLVMLGRSIRMSSQSFAAAAGARRP